MVSDKIYDLCRPILENGELGEEDKIEQLEELLSNAPASLKGKALEDAVLGSLWQWKSATDKTSSPPPVRGVAVVRSRSPAPWLQRPGTPNSLSASPRPSSTAPAVPPGFLARTKSSQSPFSSPRASPRLPVATPVIPHSPSLSAYHFNESSPATEQYGDYGSDTVDWLVNDDASSTTSFSDAAFNNSEYMLPYTTEMTPYDMLRSILQDNRTDDELEHLLEANGYDFGQTVNSIMELQSTGTTTMPVAVPEQSRTYLVGKSMSPSSRPTTPAGQQKSPIVCRYWLATGHCARADCRFAHEVQNHVCKYWLQGNCIAGASCLFSHDPATLMQQLNVNSESNTPQQFAPNFQLQDYDSFPALAPTTSNPYDESSTVDPSSLTAALRQQPAFGGAPGLIPAFVPTGPRHGSGPNSRPGSRHTSRAPTPAQPNFQDDEAFPTLGSAASKPVSKRHHGKRGGHGHHNNNAPAQPSNLADVVRMSPSPGPGLNTREALKRGLRNNRSFTSSRENSSAAMAIPAPTDIPWLETGANANAAYLKARAEAFKHGGLRNKFLQSAAQAWNRNDARGAKALSIRGQNENSLMREKHREAARALYEERNKHQGTNFRELYVDLHGLHPEEAVSYLSTCLSDQRSSSRPVYAICGTGHHSKNGKDKVGKAVRLFLNERKFAFREFSVPGDRNNVGGILGIDPQSYDKEMAKAKGALGVGDGEDSGVGLDEAKREDTKVTVVKDDPRKAGAIVE